MTGRGAVMTDDWMATYKGEHRRTFGYVWTCGDDECGCSQAAIVDEFWNKVTKTTVVPVWVWEGTFFTDHEAGAEAELRAERDRLLVEDPERAAQIDWWL